MRSLLAALLVAGLLSVPAFGAINVSLQVNGSNMALYFPGQTVTIDIMAQGTASGLNSLAGDVVASGYNNLSSIPGSFAWVPSFSVNLGTGFSFVNGAPGANGGWNGFGSARTDALTNPNGGLTNWTKVASYQVQVGIMAWTPFTELTFVPGDYGGWPPSEDDGTAQIGMIIPLRFTVIPEPATLGLFALGSLLIPRSRSC